MKRSGGVIFSAVIAIIGSLVSIMMGGLMMMSSVINPVPPPNSDIPALPISPAVMLVFISLFYVGFGVWGIVSAIGLLRLRNWARICFAVFGGLLGVFSLFGGIGIFVVSRVAPPAMPPGTNVPPGFLETLFTIISIAALLISALGIWWVIYFTRLRVKEQFLGVELASLPRQFPLSITIIAWILTVGGVTLLLYLALPFPAVFFSFVLHGSAARILYLLMGAVSLIAGIGLLKKRVEAHSLAVGYFAFSLVNSLATLVLPGAQSRRLDLFNEISRGQPMPIPMSSFAAIGILFGIVTMSLGLWFMMTRRRAFVEACSR